MVIASTENGIDCRIPRFRSFFNYALYVAYFISTVMVIIVKYRIHKLKKGFKSTS